MSENQILLYVLIALIFPGIIAAILLIIFSLRNKKYLGFVEKNSVAIQRLKVLNSSFNFLRIKNCDLKHNYDNENMYDNISCLDYLVYELAYRSGPIINEIDKTISNASRYRDYLSKKDEIKCDGKCRADSSKYNFEKILKTEKQLFEYLSLHPQVSFSLRVTLYYRNMANRLISQKSCLFNKEDIEAILRELRKKKGTFYQNENIWNSICRVERGKVTNKIRFAVYARDGHRCRKCGKYTDDLEIDHIIPISKGGKSTIDNLQTLCRSCNKKKGSSIE